MAISIEVASERDILDLYSFIHSIQRHGACRRPWRDLDRSVRKGHVVMARREDGDIVAAVGFEMKVYGGDQVALLTNVRILEAALSSRERQRLMTVTAQQARLLDAQVIVVGASVRQPYAGLRWVAIRRRQFDRLPTTVQETLSAGKWTAETTRHWFYKILRSRRSTAN